MQMVSTDGISNEEAILLVFMLAIRIWLRHTSGMLNGF